MLTVRCEFAHMYSAVVGSVGLHSAFDKERVQIMQYPYTVNVLQG
jgi:hypothetical protein